MSQSEFWKIQCKQEVSAVAMVIKFTKDVLLVLFMILVMRSYYLCGT